MKNPMLLVRAAVLILLGIIGLLQILHQPRFDAFRNVDLLKLLGVGMCFGIALVIIISILRSRTRT